MGAAGRGCDQSASSCGDNRSDLREFAGTSRAQRLQLGHTAMDSSPGSIDTRNIVSVCQSGETVDRDMLREMLGYFIDENERRMIASQEAVVNGDRVLLRQLAHAMRGSAAMIGAGRLHDLAWSLEMDADSTPLPMLARAVNSLRLELDAVVAALRKAHSDALGG